MSKLYYRLESLCKYLKHYKLLDESYNSICYKIKCDNIIIEEYIKLFALMDNLNSVPHFQDMYKLFIDEYYQELADIQKRKKAKAAKEELMIEYNKKETKPITDDYIYENINLEDDLKPYLNLRTPPPKKII